jgi:molybdate transport system substrate-binding protein
MRSLFVALPALSLVMAGVSTVSAAELRVIASGALTEAFLELIPAFERATSYKVVTSFGASVGGAADSVPKRIESGEPADLVILARSGLDQLIKAGWIVQGSGVDLVRSNIGVAVRAGAPKPDITTVDALRRTLLDAKSIGYSASVSGTYISTEMLDILGIADRVKDKTRRIDSVRVGTAVARGEVEIGFQQISELLPIQGIQYVGPLPATVQKTTVLSAGMAVNATNPAAAGALIRFLTSPAAIPLMVKNGLEPFESVKP